MSADRHELDEHAISERGRIARSRHLLDLEDEVGGASWLRSLSSRNTTCCRREAGTYQHRVVPRETIIWRILLCGPLATSL